MDKKYKYDVAISFAEQDRGTALAIALALEIAGFKNIYYYHDQLEATAGKRLKYELKKIYSQETQFIVVLLSKIYLTKPIAKIELQSIYSRIKQSPDIVCVIPVWLEDTINLSTYPHLKALTHIRWDFEPKEIAKLLKINFGLERNFDLGEVFSKYYEPNINVKQLNKANISKKQQNNANIGYKK